MSYKIIKLAVENIKNIKAIDITPTDENILVGKNGAGKTAILESIEIALTGKKIESPIRNGEKRAVITVNLGSTNPNLKGLTIKKTFTQSGDRLEVLSDDKTHLKTPQKILDQLFGALSFDPLDFMSLKKEKQREALISFIDFDFVKYSADRKEAYDNRAYCNKNVARCKLNLSEYDDVSPNTSLKLISAEKKIEQLTNIKKLKNYADGEIRDIEDIDAQIIYNSNIITAANLRIKELFDLRVTKESNIALAPKFTDEDIESIEHELNNIDCNNELILRAIDRDKAVKELENASNDSKRYDDKIVALDTIKIEAIKKAEFPIPCLSVSDSCVLYNNIPINQLSSAEQIKVAVGIAMALNPTIKVILIREASLLDKDMYLAIVSLAKLKGYQLWMEKIYLGHQSGIYIECGELSDFPEDKKEV